MCKDCLAFKHYLGCFGKCKILDKMVDESEECLEYPFKEEAADENTQ